MKILSRLFSAKRDANMTSVVERDRLSKSMPGQTAAIQANRLGFLIG
jgi:hypothetical protein